MFLHYSHFLEALHFQSVFRVEWKSVGAFWHGCRLDFEAGVLVVHRERADLVRPEPKALPTEPDSAGHSSKSQNVQGKDKDALPFLRPRGFQSIVTDSFSPVLTTSL